MLSANGILSLAVPYSRTPPGGGKYGFVAKIIPNSKGEVNGRPILKFLDFAHHFVLSFGIN